MSADSQRRSASSTAAAARCMPAIVPPQAVSDRSIIDSVAGFINDVTLQTQAPQGDVKDHILWARFENAADISDPCLGDDWELEGGIAPPLLLILGYVTGIQVWIIPANGEAIEVLSWRHGSVKCLRVLPTPSAGDGESATEPNDQFLHKRPLIALCDSATSGIIGSGGSLTSGNQSQYCSVNFISLKDGENVKSIKFKNPIVDILASRSSVVVTFTERIAIFDARTLEDRLTVTTCHPSPGLSSNPVALSSRWIAYAEKKLLASKRSSGGCDGDGVTSYTATVLNAAKSLGKGLRELGEQMAAGLTGGSHSGPNSISGIAGASGTAVAGGGNQPGIVTILDIKYPIKDLSPTTGTPIASTGNDPMIAHFVAHSEAIVAMQFDASGMLLLTADKRGHDFHVFRIHPHPSGPSLAAVHHLYILHRGDTTAKVQDIAFSLDSRWVTISTLRGTSHVFPVTPYGGPAGVRTHGSPHVVNRLSRFHRSAGLSIDGRSSSPVSHLEHPSSHMPTSAYANPRIPPFPHPTVVQPLAQLRQPSSLGTQSSGSTGSKSTSTSGRQRNSSSSSSDDLVKPLRVCATFAKARSWLLDPPGSARDTPAHRMQRKPMDSLFIIAAHGALIQYDLEPKHAANIPKEKVCDDTPIELEVEAKAQWTLQRQESSVSGDIQPPLPVDNWLIKDRFLEEVSGADTGGDYSSIDLHHRGGGGSGDHRGSSSSIDHDDRWLSQVEIITHAGPHRRLWMGPQFMFKTYNTPSGSPLTSIDTDSVEIGAGTTINRPARSNPMNMPISGGMRPLVPVLIESGSCSYEQSPRMINMTEFRHHENLDTEFASLGPVESQLREDLADAMRESPLISSGRDTTGYTCATPIPAGLSSVSSCSSTSIYSSTHSLNSICDHKLPPSITTLAQGVPVKHHQHYHLQQQDQRSSSLPTSCSRPASAASSRASGSITIAKVVNPLGTVTTVCNVDSEGPDPDAEARTARDCDAYMHENCDEALFRPVVTVHGLSGPERDLCGSSLDRITSAQTSTEEPPSMIGRELIVPVIEEKNMIYFSKAKNKDDENVAKFEELSSINRKSKKEVVAKPSEGEFVTIEAPQQCKPVEEPKVTGSKRKEKTPPMVSSASATKSDRKKKTQSEPIEVIELPDPGQKEVELPPAEKPVRNRKKENGKKKDDPKPVQKQKQPTQAEAKSTRTSGGNANNNAGVNNNRKENKQDNRRRKEQTPQPPPPVPAPPQPKPEPEEVVQPLTVQPRPVDEELLKSICDDFPPLEALKIDDLELFGESNEPENLKLTRTEISVQESMLASGEPVELGDGEGETALSRVDREKSVEEPDVMCVREVLCEDEPKVVVKEEKFYDPSGRYELEFPEPLPPLEPFVCKDFEDLGFNESVKEKLLKQPSEERTLISFESPQQEDAKEVVALAKNRSLLEERNIVFAMCSSLRDASLSGGMGESSCSQQLGGSRSLSSSMMQSGPVVLRQQLSVEGQDSDYKSLELDIDDTAMFMSRLPVSSASDEETSNSNNDEADEESKVSRRTHLRTGEDEDEELEPLISSNKTSSSSLSTTVVGSAAPSASGPTDSLSNSMTTSGIVAAAAESPAKTSSTITTTTTSALPTTEANQSEQSDKQTTAEAAAAKQSNNGGGGGGGGNNGNNNGNGNFKKRSKKRRK
ncbi:breast carcinoma-amplified sequence 3 homolog isoform X2 [Wyeomyia smithii]|uniref:breast carcinoma-amplified sequence 3 homolog isoform X2 n=1 Tax=Wyeomyia smithii TaxID=174621 RepID=UPI00246814E5|nr:breast carcinoma-amplified sequence 3 homolog isoform X2 [Wyeomyia smithii]